MPREEVSESFYMNPVGLAGAPVVGKLIVAHGGVPGPAGAGQEAVFVFLSVIISFIGIAVEYNLIDAAGHGPLNVPQLISPGLLVIAGIDPLRPRVRSSPPRLLWN